MLSIKKLNKSLGDHHRIYIYRICLNSYTSENMLMLHKPKSENRDITTIRTSSDSYLRWKKLFHKNPLFFRIFTDFKADNEIDNSSIVNKTTNIYKQSLVFNGYHILSELENV